MSVPAMRPSYAANWRDWSRRATTLGMSPEASRIMGRTHGTRIWSWARTRMVELPYCPSEVAVRRHLRRPGGLRPVGYAPLGNRHETLQRGVHRRQEPDRIFTGRTVEPRHP